MPVTPPTDPRPSLAVVPFWSEAPDATSAAAATAGVARALAGLSTWLAVTRTSATIPGATIPGATIPRAATQGATTQGATSRGPTDLRRLHRGSGIRYVLQGRVEAERSRLRLSVELSEAETGRVLWSNRCDNHRDQVAALHEAALSAVGDGVPATVYQRELERLALMPTEALTSHDLALGAFGKIMRPTRAGFAEAAELLAEAAQRAEPHATLWYVRSWWHLIAVSQGWTDDPAAAIAAAVAAAERTDHLDAAAQSLRAWTRAMADGDLSMAAETLDRVIDAAPLCCVAWTLKALVLAGRGEADAAIFHAEQAGTMPVLGPERAWRDGVMALCSYLAGQYAVAVRRARGVAPDHAGLAMTLRVLAASLIMLGRMDEAARVAKQLLVIDPGFRLGAWRRHAALPPETQEMLVGGYVWPGCRSRRWIR